MVGFISINLLSIFNSWSHEQNFCCSISGFLTLVLKEYFQFIVWNCYHLIFPLDCQSTDLISALVWPWLIEKSTIILFKYYWRAFGWKCYYVKKVTIEIKSSPQIWSQINAIVVVILLLQWVWQMRFHTSGSSFFMCLWNLLAPPFYFTGINKYLLIDVKEWVITAGNILCKNHNSKSKNAKVYLGSIHPVKIVTHYSQNSDVDLKNIQSSLYYGFEEWRLKIWSLNVTNLSILIHVLLIVLYFCLVLFSNFTNWAKSWKTLTIFEVIYFLPLYLQWNKWELD